MFAFQVAEGDEAPTDLNSDGDTGDFVVHLHDVDTRTTTNLAVDGDQLQLQGSKLVFGLSEARQGAADLNGDGDVLDGVVFTHDLTLGTVTNTGLAEPANPGWVAVAGRNVLIPVTETDQGVDLNGDGDVSALDNVLHRVQLGP